MGSATLAEGCILSTQNFESFEGAVRKPLTEVASFLTGVVGFLGVERMISSEDSSSTTIARRRFPAATI